MGINNSQTIQKFQFANKYGQIFTAQLLTLYDDDEDNSAILGYFILGMEVFRLLSLCCEAIFN
jgi:hypothetical protein